MAAESIDESRNKFLSVTPDYDLICNSIKLAHVKERGLTYISLEQIKKVIPQEESAI